MTVREFVSDFEAVVGHKLNITETAPRTGDIAGAYTRIDKARSLPGWKPELSMQTAIRNNIEWFDRFHNKNKK